jgi:uncharacterized OB-fold protein
MTDHGGFVPDETNPETAPFWQAAREGRFLIKRCRTCTRHHWYPRAICPHCFSDDTEWVEAAGEGTIYTYTGLPKEGPVEALAYVTLSEGPSVLTKVEAASWDDLVVGRRVRVIFHARGDSPPIACFTVEDRPGRAG